MGPEVSFNAVTKSYSSPDGVRNTVLDNVDLSIPAGAFLRLDGPSGSGKSTILNLIAGLFLPDKGTISVGNKEITSFSESERDTFRSENIGYVFQTFNLLSPLTVMENLTIPSILANRKESKSKTEIEKLLTKFGIFDQRKKKPFQLSVGQRQRVAIIRAILNKPKILLSDEPTANLDLASAKIVIDSMLELKESGVTLIVATHDPSFAKLSSDMVYNVEKGELI